MSDNNTQDVTSQSSYQSSDAQVATVNSSGLLTAVGAGTASITATYQGQSANVSVTVAPVPTVQGITAAPNPVALFPSQARQLDVTAAISDNSTQDVTCGSGFASSDSGIATVSASGLVTGVASGGATITVAYQGRTARVPVTVAPAAEVTPTGNGIILRDPGDLNPVAYNAAAGFTVTTSGDGDPVTQVVVSAAGSTPDGWPCSEIALSLQSPVIIGDDVVVSYNADPNYPITRITTGTQVGIQASPVTNDSTLPLSVGTVTVLASGGAVEVRLPGNVAPVTYNDGAGFVITTGTVQIPVTKVVTSGDMAELFPEEPIAQELPVSVGYSPVSTEPITTVTGTPLAATTQPVTATNLSTAPLVYQTPVLEPNGTIIIPVQADLGHTTCSGSMGFSVYANGRQIPVLLVQVDGDIIYLTLGAPLAGDSFRVVCPPGIEGTTIVAPVNLVYLTADPSGVTLRVGTAAQLGITGNYSDGSSQDVTGLSTFTSSDPVVATVDPTGLVTGAAAGGTVVSATYGGQSVQTSVTVTPVLTGLSVSPDPVDLDQGGTQQLSVSADYSDDSKQDVTGSSTFTSSNPAVATVKSSGAVTGAVFGTATITAVYGGQSAQVSVSVKPAGISVFQPSITLNQGGTYQIRVTANPGNRDVGKLANYRTANPGVVIVSPTGLITANAPGTATVTISYGGQATTMTVTVAPVLQKISVAPDPVNLNQGANSQLKVTAAFSDGTSRDVTGASTFTSTSSGPVTVSGSGLVTAAAPGSAVVTAVYSGQSAQVPVNVAATLQGISVNPNPVSINQGQSQQLTVTATMSDGHTQDVTKPANYSSSNPTVAVVGINGGVVSGLTPGSATVTVTYQGRTGQVPVTIAPVLQGITAGPSPVTLNQGATRQLAVTAAVSDGTTHDVTAGSTFSSSDSPVATVSDTGLVTGAAPGSATITVSYQGRTIQVPVVIAAVLQGITASPNPVSINQGGSRQLTITADMSDATTQDVTRLANYSSSNLYVSPVGSTGLVNGSSPGTAMITVIYEAQTVQVPVTVVPVATSLTVTPNPVNLDQGGTRQLTVSAHMSDGTGQDVTGQAAYQVDNSQVASVGAGLVTGIAPGSATITVTCGGQSDQVPVTVAPVLQGIAVNPDPVTMNQGATRQLTVTARYSDGNQKDITAGAGYQTNESGIAASYGLGKIGGVSPGSATITVTYSGQSVQVPVTVAPVVQSITVNPSPVNLNIGATQQLTVTAHMSDGTTKDATADARYACGDAQVASVSNGVVTGVAVGNTHITVSCNGFALNVAVGVNPPAPKPLGVTVTPNPLGMWEDNTANLDVILDLSNGQTTDVTSGSTFASSNPPVASVSAYGVVWAYSPGSATITVTYNGMAVEVPVTVNIL